MRCKFERETTRLCELELTASHGTRRNLSPFNFTLLLGLTFPILTIVHINFQHARRASVTRSNVTKCAKVPSGSDCQYLCRYRLKNLKEQSR